MNKRLSDKEILKEIETILRIEKLNINFYSTPSEEFCNKLLLLIKKTTLHSEDNSSE